MQLINPKLCSLKNCSIESIRTKRCSEIFFNRHDYRIQQQQTNAAKTFKIAGYGRALYIGPCRQQAAEKVFSNYSYVLLREYPTYAHQFVTEHSCRLL